MTDTQFARSDEELAELLRTIDTQIKYLKQSPSVWDEITSLQDKCASADSLWEVLKIDFPSLPTQRKKHYRENLKRYKARLKEIRAVIKAEKAAAEQSHPRKTADGNDHSDSSALSRRSSHSALDIGVLAESKTDEDGTPRSRMEPDARAAGFKTPLGAGERRAASATPAAKAKPSALQLLQTPPTSVSKRLSSPTIFSPVPVARSSTALALSPSASQAEEPEDEKQHEAFRIQDVMRRKLAEIKSARKAAKDDEREKKWTDMLHAEGGDWNRYDAKNYDTVKRRVRKGIPESVRAQVWPRLCGATYQQKQNPGLFAELRQQNADHEVELQIKKDKRRTFQNHDLFRNQVGGSENLDADQGYGQNALFSVLKVYALFNPRLGYCQGMASPAAVFIMHVDEQQAFWMLERVLDSEKYERFGGVFEPGFPLLFRFLFYHEQFMHRFCPKLLAHFQQCGVQSSIYGTRWFTTLYTQFPLDLVLRLFDIFLYEGVKVLFRTAIYLLKQKQKQLLSADFEGIVVCLQELHNEPFLAHTDDVITAMLKVDIKHADLEAFSKQYADKHPDAVKTVQVQHQFAHGATPPLGLRTNSHAKLPGLDASAGAKRGKGGESRHAAEASGDKAGKDRRKSTAV